MKAKFWLCLGIMTTFRALSSLFGIICYSLLCLLSVAAKTTTISILCDLTCPTYDYLDIEGLTFASLWLTASLGFPTRRTNHGDGRVFSQANLAIDPRGQEEADHHLDFSQHGRSSPSAAFFSRRLLLTVFCRRRQTPWVTALLSCQRENSR